MTSKSKLKQLNSPNYQSRRDKIEAELNAITPMSPNLRKLTSAEGFIDYYLEMCDLYTSRLEAYERLEDFHIQATSRRRYSEFSSFRRVMGRYLKNCLNRRGCITRQGK